MPSRTLTDSPAGVWIERVDLGPGDLGLPASDPWVVRKRALRGGRREGVDLIEVEHGGLTLAIVPTRGMGIWRAQHGELRLGWGSPVKDGPVNPAFVNLADLGGLGWLQGFDELMARCGLEHNGAPYVVAEGDGRQTAYPLHGRIANIPAHYVAVHVGDGPPHAITVEGHVNEARLFGMKVRMVTRITTVPGSRRITVRDEFTNLGDLPAEMQILYHWNFGPPLLGEGSRIVLPARAVVPRNARAVEGLGHHDVYGPPEPGFAEQVYFFEPIGEGADGRTVALLHDHAGGRGVALRFATSQLPCFTLWKNSGGLKDGYVTGLEPGTNYPNPKPFEAQRGRVVKLASGASHVAEMTLDVLDSAEAVAAAGAEIRALQAGEPPTIHPGPVEPFAAP
jgi:hypothetical protein